MLPEPVTKSQHAIDFFAAAREYVKIAGEPRCLKQSMLEPVRFTNSQDETKCFKARHVRKLVGRVRYSHDDIDYGFRCQPWDGRCTDMFDKNHAFAQCLPDLLGKMGKLRRPLRIVRRELNFTMQRLSFADCYGREVLVCRRCSVGLNHSHLLG